MTNLQARAATASLAGALLAVASIAAAGWAQAPSTIAGPTTGPTFDRLMSDDGRLTISVPFGAGPDVRSLSIVHVEVAAPAVAAYELRPLGTTFPVPVSVAWQLDPTGTPAATNGDLRWLAMAHAQAATTGPWSWLDDAHVAVVDGAYTITGLLSQFGTLVVTQLPTLVRGPDAIWGPGYSPGRGIEVPLDLSLVTPAGAPSTAAFSGDWRFGGGYPGLIGVTTTVSEADRLAAVWQCQRTGTTSLMTMFGVREDVIGPATTGQLSHPGPAAAEFSVTFPVACGTVHAQPDGQGLTKSS